MEIKLKETFASNCDVNEQDTRNIKRALNCLGYYIPNKKIGIVGIPDTEIFESVKKFQQDNEILVTGEIRPNDDTVEALNNNIKSKIKVSDNV